MYHRIVMTAGISTFGPNNAPGKWLRQEATNVARIERFQLLHPTSKKDLDEAGREALHAAWRKDRPALEDPSAISAEYSMLLALRAANRLADNPVVVLIATDTPIGQAATDIIGDLLQRDFGATVTRRHVDELNVMSRPKMRRSLGAFMGLVASELRAGEPRSTCFAPLGGFKVMTSLGYVAGAYMRYPTAYLHEGNQVLHEIPWVPLNLDPKALRALAPLVRRATAGAEIASLDASQRRSLTESPFLFERDDELLYLNAFGVFLRDEPQYRPILGTRVMLDTALVSTLKEHHSVVSREILHLIDRLGNLQANRNLLHHEANFKHHNTRFHLYKGSSGEQVFRAAWRHEDHHDTLYLRQIWLDHAVYEREAKAGSVLNGEHQRWIDVTEDLEFSQ